MGSRISTHRPPPNFFLLLPDPLSFSFVRQKVSWADSLKDSTCPASLRQTDTFHVSGGDADRLSFYPPIHLSTDAHPRTHIQIFTFLHLSCSFACLTWLQFIFRGVWDRYMRVFVAEDRMCAHMLLLTWVLHLYMYMRVHVYVTPIVLVFVPYPVEQRRWDPTSDRWYNWTGQTVLVSFLGLHSWNSFVSTHHPRLYSRIAEECISCTLQDYICFINLIFWEIIY